MSRTEYEDLQELINNLEDLPSSKPVTLLNKSGDILFSNKTFRLQFGLNIGQNIRLLDTEPALYSFIEEFCESKYSSIHFDLMLNNNINDDILFDIQIEKIVIANTVLLFIRFSSLEEKRIIENRINNLHNALEYGNVAVIILDSGGAITYSSRAFETILGKSIEQLYRLHIIDALKNFLTGNETEFLLYALKNKKEWIKLVSDINSNGELWFKEIRLSPVKRIDSDLSTFILVANDITNYILKNRLIRRSEEKQKTVINNISDLLLIVRRKGNSLVFDNANEKFYSVFEVDKNKVGQQELIEFMPVELFDKLTSTINNHNNEKISQFKYQHSVSKREYFCKLTSTDDPYEKVSLYILSMADITEQIQHEERLKEAYQKEIQLNKLKSAFMANMSHEIRTPLNAIVGYSDLLEDEITERNDSDLGEIVNYLKDGVKRLLNLVDNIVEVSILESGEMTLDMIKISINSFIHNLLPDYQKRKVERGVEVLFEPDIADPLIMIDEGKLKKILDMLVDNAFKYNKDNGKIFIKINSSVDLVRILIEDTGIGINESKIENILKPFQQEEEEGHKRNYEGAGLGLTIAYRLTKLLEGRLDIRSKIDIGTTIQLTFPRVYR